MGNYKILLGYASVAVAIISFGIYFWEIFKQRVKPHAFTWFVWGVINTIAFIAEWVSNAGAGSWVIFANAACCFAIALIGFYQGHVKYSLFDWVSLGAALIAVMLWQITNRPLLAVILVAMADAIAILPSLKKAYFKPFEDNASSFMVEIIYYVLALFALNSFKLTNYLYPLEIILVDTIFIAVILIRRKKVV